MTNIQEKIANIKLIPVIKLDHAEDAIPLAKALIEGGLPVMEITFRTDAAEESIRAVSKAYPDVLTGAGTVITLEQVKKAHSAGAKYIVTPGISRPVIEYCCLNNIPVYPGACTPTEIIQVMEFGLDVVKFFPAEQYGGLSTIKALSAPFPQIKFIPTGGISESNLKEYLTFQKILACGGSWMVKDDLIKAKNFKEIKNKTKEAVELIND
ncbi:MAG: bifunctional 4-hydroxy-2-oxoglutarate aldolase/2-dehydro-3-deoxy-phosphogluconate aldolase [Oscillospiraceae bacterium]|jgi:2-dehydro-3-deoxyphosphogluconate aldolase/(4S)-4-hydroxy-2-oxoglutarate aldolase|nr:bifunctional 4-hydroxy-2-oxoglutarate aldolase/2-dehydro-3-deoxy-phosphogluconate aldolase [Oscillospiraceae bacterium]